MLVLQRLERGGGVAGRGGGGGDNVTGSEGVRGCRGRRHKTRAVNVMISFSAKRKLAFLVAENEIR